MLLELLISNPFVIITFSLIFIVMVLSLFGFMGNININTSGGGNVNISGIPSEVELSAERTEICASDNLLKIVVNNPVGSVNIRVAADNNVTVIKKLYLSKDVTAEEKKSFVVTFEQDMMSVNTDELNINVPTFSGKGLMSSRVDLEITAPASMSFKQLPGVNDIIVEGRNGDVELNNNAGNLTVNNVSGVLKAHNNAGNIIGHSLKCVSSLIVNAGEISVTGVGLNNTSSKIHSSVGNVNVEVIYVDDPVNCDISSNTGNVSLILARNLALQFKASTKMGKLDIDSDIHIVSREKSFMGGSLVGSLHDGSSSISLSSNTGAIRVSLK